MTIILVRRFLLAGALLGFLEATVLFGVTQRYLIAPWLRVNEGAGARLPAFVRRPEFQRGWLLLTTLVFGLLYWLSFTSAGYTWIERAGR